MRLEPIGVSDLAATGLNPFPIAEPVADVLRASQTGANLGNQLIDLNNNQESLQTVDPTPVVDSNPNNTRRQIQDDVELSEASRNAAEPLPEARAQDSLSPEILPEIQGANPEPVGAAQLSQAERQVLSGPRLLSNDEFQLDLDNALQARRLNSEPQLTTQTVPTVNQPDLDIQVPETSTDIEFPPETPATNPRLGLTQNTPGLESSQPQGVETEFPPDFESPEISSGPATTQSDNDETPEVNGQNNQVSESQSSPEERVNTPQSNTPASDSGNEDRGRLLERTYTGSSNSTTINESNFVAIG